MIIAKNSPNTQHKPTETIGRVTTTFSTRALGLELARREHNRLHVICYNIISMFRHSPFISTMDRHGRRLTCII